MHNSATQVPMLRIFFLILVISYLAFCQLNPASASSHSGKIYLQVQANGEAWYVNPADGKRHYLGRPDDAFMVMREFSLGISNADFEAAHEATPQRLLGRILLKVHDHGKAYYLDPRNGFFYYLGLPSDAFNIMRSRGIGITNSELYKIPASVSNLPPANDNQSYGSEPADTRGSVNIAELENLIHKKVNAKRSEKGLLNLAWDTELAAIAREHSTDMSFNSYFSNTDSSGCSTACRMDKEHYLYKKIAESIATGYTYRFKYTDGTYGGFRTVDEIADAFVDIWVKNNFIFNNFYENQGIGAAIDANDKIYLTNNLSDPLVTFDEQYELKSFLNTIIDPADNAMDKILKIHDWITDNVSYDIANYLADTVPDEDFEPYPTYANRKGVCQGYADLMRVLLKLSGIESEKVSGQSDGMNGYASHAWLKVAQNQEELYIDVTWDSGHILNSSFVKSPSHTYYLIPKTCIAVDHSEEGEAPKTASEQKAYVNSNASVFNEKCPALKERILSK